MKAYSNLSRATSILFEGVIELRVEADLAKKKAVINCFSAILSISRHISSYLQYTPLYLRSLNKLVLKKVYLLNVST